MRRRAPGRVVPIALSSATVPRTNARQPSAGGGSPASKRSASPYTSASASISAAPGRLRPDGHAGLHRERQAEAGVVVGVLPEQVDAAGTLRSHSTRSSSRAVKAVSGKSEKTPSIPSS